MIERAEGAGSVVSRQCPEGVSVRRLTPRPDARGSLVEFHRGIWADPVPVQWNCVTSNAGALRGVHVHERHWDSLVLLSGAMVIGFHDMRADSVTCGASWIVELSGASPASVRIPPGVAHGFCFVEDSMTLYGLSEYWHPDHDDWGCRYDDPALGLDWPVVDPVLSPRDRDAGSLEELRAIYQAAAGPSHTTPA